MLLNEITGKHLKENRKKSEKRHSDGKDTSEDITPQTCPFQLLSGYFNISKYANDRVDRAFQVSFFVAR